MAKKKKKQSIGRNVIFGRVISSDFFTRHWLAITIFIVVIMVYITTKFTYRANIERITALERQLEVVQNEKDRERSEFRSRTRETAMQRITVDADLTLLAGTNVTYVLPTT
ncbi:MAG: DUF2730 domain-containing protein, partial [Duncaniella sp.]|nr:DUF2730 domain-containing protein [Duncaniella sp.]